MSGVLVPWRTQQLTIAVAASGICLGTAAFMFPDNLNGLSDLLADAALVSIVGFATALNPSCDLQDMIAKFKSFTGGSTVSYGLLVPEKLTGFLQTGLPALAGGSAGMAAASLVLPGIVAQGLADVVGRLIGAVPPQTGHEPDIELQERTGQEPSHA